MTRSYLLGIESTCDETAAAVIGDDGSVLSSIVASQYELHQEFGGVVPEIASRAHVRRIIPTIRTALKQASITASDLAAVAVTSQPGLVGSLLVGLTAAKTIAMSLKIPLVAVNHIDAHIYSCAMGQKNPVYPCVGFVVSGGHTNLYNCRSATDCRLIGGTMDDAAGEAFDKVARILNLSYPGGPSIQRTAKHGNPDVFPMPRPMLQKPNLDFSFSGLKTAVLYAARGLPGNDQLAETPAERVPDLAAAFQAAVVDVLVQKAQRALRTTGHLRLSVGGGVAANQLFRSKLREMCQREQVELFTAAPEMCTDNAAMAAVAWEHLRQGTTSDLHVDVLPGLIRPDSARRLGNRRRQNSF